MTRICWRTSFWALLPPEAPRWLEKDYHRAIRELAEIGAAEISRTEEPEGVRASQRDCHCPGPSDPRKTLRKLFRR
jgi:hypothetical protein